MSRDAIDQVKQDVALAKNVIAALDWHALVDASQVAVGADHGVVTVVGSVPSMAEKLVVLDEVDSVAGVVDVVSHLEVVSTLGGGGQEDRLELDRELERVITEAIRWNALVSNEPVECVVTDGWVTLRGAVPTAAQRGEAERAVAHILGVRGVTNEIEIASAAVSAGDVRDAIVEALQRHAAHQASNVRVVVDGDRVTLSGSVASPLEKRAVLGAVSHAPGVEAVCEDLMVHHPSGPISP